MPPMREESARAVRGGDALDGSFGLDAAQVEADLAIDGIIDGDREARLEVRSRRSARRHRP